MKTIVRTLLCLGGAVILLVLGALTLFGPIPELFGLPLLFIIGIAYGMNFEKAFWATLVIASGLILFWLGIQLYPDYASKPIVVVVYSLSAAAAIALLAWQAVVRARTIDREKREKQKREERKAITRRLVEEQNIEPRPGEPSPPWIQFPDFVFFHGLAHFGPYEPGEIYRDEEWAPFWRSLTINQRHEYFHHYDLGNQWPERDDWYSFWVTWEQTEESSAYSEKLVAEATLETRPGEVAPPWVKYPELDDATFHWNEGEGGDYLKQKFLPFFESLTTDQKEDFLRRHDLGLGWEDRDEWMRLIDWEGK